MTDLKVKVLVPIRYPVGGIRTYLKYTYGKLDREKYSFTLIGPSRNWLERIGADLNQYEVDIVCSSKEDNNLAFFSAIAGSFFKKKPDIIHSQGYTAGLLSILANIPFGLPHMITLHRTFGHDQFSSTFWGRKAALKKHASQFLLQRADLIQSVSNDAQANLLEYFPGLVKKADKLKVIRNGIMVDEFDGHVQTDGETFTREPGFFYIGYFGRYMPEKGFPHLMEMVDILVNQRNIRNIRIVSVGGFGEFIREYQKEIKKKGLEEYFQFLGFFMNISPVLRKIDMLIIPSLSEACPLIPMEGLVCGTPVVAYSCLGLREILYDTPARMALAGDCAGLADQVINIMDNYSNIKPEFQAFAHEARQRFDSAHTANRLEEVFEKLIAENSLR